MYKPGLHIISEFEVKNPSELSHCEKIKKHIDNCIEKYSLQKVGEVYYEFPTGGYTAVVCLTESHISIHTWPEFNKVTFDVFLSNYQKYNDGSVEEMHDGILQLMEATKVNSTRIKR